LRRPMFEMCVVHMIFLCVFESIVHLASCITCSSNNIRTQSLLASGPQGLDWVRHLDEELVCLRCQAQCYHGLKLLRHSCNGNPMQGDVVLQHC
jgi:hypothetical protein